MLLVVIGVLAGWAHHSLSAARPGSPTIAATPPASDVVRPLPAPSLHAQLRAWLTDTQPSMHALVVARDGIAPPAANHDLDGTAAACQTADDAVASLRQRLPSPDPMLTTAVEQALNSYHAGLRFCVWGVHNRDGNAIEQAVMYLRRADAEWQAAVDILQHDLGEPGFHDPGAMTT
ncbi:MAG: hypothetical protein QJR12_13770 [Mycobacterium sp.]|uniref:hypothetical protein n=1 Tax=Mycobacterium sp. TaxID=1785 RepID=UPI00260493AA|nr:hypothetical protein [Mycobacterium sp.]MDI3315288.1 hypothetical protein [Mycobacterium sp.]